MLGFVFASASGFGWVEMAFEKEESGGDIIYRKLFVGGLAWETQSHTLRRHFEQFGDILEAVVITDKNTRRSKGYGFVTFRDPVSAERACANRAPIIDGRKANCNLAYFGQTHSPLPSSGRLRPAIAVTKGVQKTIGTYVGIPYQPGFVCPPYGYVTYEPGIVYPQGVYNSYLGQHYLQVYEASSGTVNSVADSHGQLSLPLAGSVHSYGMPGQNNLRLGGSIVNGIVAASVPMIQSPYPAGTSPYPTGVPAAAPGQTPMAVPAQPSIPSSTGSSNS